MMRSRSSAGGEAGEARGAPRGLGRARFCYTGQNAGNDTIRAFADTDRDGTRDPGEPQGQAAKTWT
jgi:hypothetical protein